MVFNLTTPNGAGHFDGFCKSYDRSYGRTMNEATYHDFLQRGMAWPGAYIFGDRWRMNGYQARLAALIWDKLEAAGDRRASSADTGDRGESSAAMGDRRARSAATVRLLNDPRKQLGRYEFLKVLHQDGINDFDVYRLAELSSSVRYPVLVRREHDHAGPLTELLANGDELQGALDRLILGGNDPQELLVIEYVETVCPDGIYRKHGVMRIGDVIFPHHIMSAREWHTKADVRIRTEEAIAESDAFTLANPHAELVMPIFERAGIDYGRIDYAMVGDRIQVWEINDNPIFMHMGARPQSKLQRHVTMKAAFDKLSEGLTPGEPMRFELSPEEVWTALQEGGAA